MGDYSVALRGYADRIDVLNNGTLRIVDYKSGGSDRNFEDIESLFNTDTTTQARSFKRNIAALQTMIYALIILQMTGNEQVAPSVYAMRDIGRDDFSPYFNSKSKGQILEKLEDDDIAQLESNLRDMFNLIFDVAIPFEQCATADACDRCDYKELCNRV